MIERLIRSALTLAFCASAAPVVALGVPAGGGSLEKLAQLQKTLEALASREGLPLQAQPQMQPNIMAPDPHSTPEPHRPTSERYNR